MNNVTKSFMSHDTGDEFEQLPEEVRARLLGPRQIVIREDGTRKIVGPKVEFKGKTFQLEMVLEGKITSPDGKVRYIEGRY
jgi:hypothetical protein